jgi:3-hydroxyacyl-CoA dehydrogenase
MSEHEVVRYEVENGIGVITIDNPPVNALGPGVPEGIIDAVDQGNADPERQGDGADRRRAQLHRRRRHPPVRQSAPTPSPPASYAGTRREREAGRRRDPRLCAGRGARARARLPLPHRRAERPGRAARGADRHPAGRRRHAAPAAADRPQGGAGDDRHRAPRTRAEEAKELGIIDELVPEGPPRSGHRLREERRRYARCRASARSDRPARAKADPGMFEAMRKSIARRARNQKAPYNCIAGGRGGDELPFDEGLCRRAPALRRARASDEAKALRYAFFAEREVAKIPGVPRDTSLPDEEPGSSAPARWAAASP